MVEISQTLSGRSAIIDLIKKQLRGHCLRNCLLNTRRNQFGRHCLPNVLYRYPYPMSAGPACTISMQGIRFVQQVAALQSGQGNVIISIVSTVPGLLSCSRKPGKPDPGICSFLRNLVKKPTESPIGQTVSDQSGYQVPGKMSHRLWDKSSFSDPD